ncbi:hypothetical protein UFOVP97_26 [uncultured Caudovirales phage]|uniref:Uncharacterized protein n=1 Tax=uncultured Caudovirales phage TaxID=2100421 RepID=A0A6J5LMU5_9CAUD|nr:hypothetical protein UFOVP97_26 [uncultured Caudovirales phage]CAB4134327.1 hypothetical protein UFOVP268_44 [uncultured Caudovirales phage]
MIYIGLIMVGIFLLSYFVFFLLWFNTLQESIMQLEKKLSNVTSSHVHIQTVVESISGKIDSLQSRIYQLTNKYEKQSEEVKVVQKRPMRSNGKSVKEKVMGL